MYTTEVRWPSKDSLWTVCGLIVGQTIGDNIDFKGKKILNANQVEDGGTYVACGNEKFKQMAYGTKYVLKIFRLRIPQSFWKFDSFFK